MTHVAETEPPSSREAILKLVEAQRSKVMRWQATRVREIEREAEKELASLQRVAGSVSVGSNEASLGKRPRNKAGSPTALAAERRDAIARLLAEREEALALGEIWRTLHITEFSTRSALKRLCEEGRITRTGTGSSTRYLAKPTSGSAAGDSRDATDAGRVLEVVRSRVATTLGEIAEATMIDEDEVRRICGGLIVDGEIEMGQRDGQKVYLAGRAA